MYGVEDLCFGLAVPILGRLQGLHSDMGCSIFAVSDSIPGADRDDDL